MNAQLRISTYLLLVSSFAVLLMFLASDAFAQTASSSAESTPSSTVRRDAQNRLLETRTNAASKAAAMQDKKELRLSAMQEKVASRTAIVKERLAKFRNKQKAAIVERINENLNLVNEKRTTHMLQNLTKMSDILSKLNTNVNNSGVEVDSAVQGAITKAESEVKVAKTAAEAQAQKMYVIEATSEARIKDDAQAARDQLHTDLNAVHTLIVGARKSVADAIRTAVSNIGGTSNGQ